MQEVLNHDATANLTPDSHDFFVVANAIKWFLDTEGVLPVSGRVPDMVSTSEFYLQLQNIYAAKARKDVDAIIRYVAGILPKLGRHVNSISTEFIVNVVKNANFIAYVHYIHKHALIDTLYLVIFI